MALPKRKTSKARRDKRRTHKKTDAPNVVPCPNCGEQKLPHHVCPECGYYKDNEVIEVEE